jgi:hypothetical protein
MLIVPELITYKFLLHYYAELIAALGVSVSRCLVLEFHWISVMHEAF